MVWLALLRATLDYVTERKQFGKPISKYQLIQEKLAMMQGNLAQAMATCAQLANMQAHGEYDEVATSTAKMMNALRLRETVAMGRGITGGNGILADDYDIARFFSDAEAIYTYEGTHEINAFSNWTRFDWRFCFRINSKELYVMQ